MTTDLLQLQKAEFNQNGVDRESQHTLVEYGSFFIIIIIEYPNLDMKE